MLGDTDAVIANFDDEFPARRHCRAHANGTAVFGKLDCI